MVYRFAKLRKIHRSINLVTKRIFCCFLLILSNNYIFSQAETSIRTLVIDPGHGGHDPGNLGTGRYSKTEKHIALEISLKVGQYIRDSFPDVNLIFTRKTNEDFLKLGERTQLANDNNADLFMSIHCDGFSDPKAYGAGVFVMGMSKLKANMDIAMKENAVIYLEDDYQKNYEGFDPNSPESYIVFSLTQDVHLDQSLQIAELVHEQFSEGANRKSRGVKQAPFYVISRANMPSILIEAGFLTNPEEEDYLHSQEGQERLSLAIFNAFKLYKAKIENLPSDGIKKDSIDIKEKRTKVPNSKKGLELSDSLVFKIQIGTYLKSMLNSPLFEGIDLEELEVNGTYKYFTFNTNDKNQANKEKERLRSIGFSGSFVVAFYKGKQISVKEALNLQNKDQKE